MAGLLLVSPRALGLSLIVITAVIWVISSFISASLVTPSTSGGKAAVPPFLLTYLATSLFTLYLPFVHGRQLVLDAWAAWSLRRKLRCAELSSPKV